jgi:hypothetical protein
MFYPNQIETARSIANAFMGVHWVCLKAQMQSGKTGTFLFTCFEMHKEKKIEKSYYVCGSSDTKLKAQVVKDKKDALEDYREHLTHKLCDESQTLDNKIKYKG